MESFFVNILIPVCSLLLGLTLVLAIVFPVIQIAKNPKNAKGALIGVVALVVIVGISYALSDELHISKIDIEPSEAKLAGTGIFAFYIVAGIAILGLIYSSVAKFFK